jgi:anti-sigma regulatory factor (Ser/Thr protein kinase)
MTVAGTLAHRAVVYDDREVVAGALAQSVRDAVERGEGVLFSLDDRFRDVFADALGPTAEHVTFVPVEARYARPVEAMGSLWRFIRTAIAGGAAKIHAIGELPTDGGRLRDEWQWYEAACNEVLADIPLVATCLYDGTSIAASTKEAVARTHPEFIGGNGSGRPAEYRDGPPAMPAAPEPPAREADVALRGVADPATARHGVESLGVSGELEERGRLVVTELVTNAIRHGGGSADVDVWWDDPALVLRVHDGGGGLDDPFATIRPVREWTVGGAGLWICNVECDDLAVRSDAGATEVVAIIRPRA